MSLDIHNPYCSLWHDTAMSFPAPWDEQKTHERSPFLFFGTLLQSKMKTDITSSSSKRKTFGSAYGDKGGEENDSLPTFLSLYGSAGSVSASNTFFSDTLASNSNSKKHVKRSSIRFSNTVNCILIPSREDLAPLKDILWQTDEEVEIAIISAQNEIEGTLTTCESGLSLYSTMSLLYRPCQNRPHSHLRILIVDDSMVCVKMLIYMLTKGKKLVGIQDDLIIHHVASAAAATQQSQGRSYNVIIVDEILNADPKATIGLITRSTSSSVSSDGNTSYENSGSDDDSNEKPKAHGDDRLQGHQLCKLLRGSNENCVIVGISSLMSDLANPHASIEENSACNKVKNQFLDCGADFVWAKPMPSPTQAWEDLLQRLPLEF